MLTLSKLAAAVVIGTAAFVGTAQAATTPITVVNEASPTLLTVDTAVNGDTKTFSFDYLGGVLKLLLIDTTPDEKSVQYKLFSPELTEVLKDTNVLGTEPSVSWSLAAGSYVLQITNLGSTMFSATQISAVPVPGAALLFGTTVLGFFGLNKRRKG